MAAALANAAFIELLSRRDGKSTGGPEVGNGGVRSVFKQVAKETAVATRAPAPERRELRLDRKSVV